jgi:integrase
MSIFRKPYTRPVPTDAKRLKRKGTNGRPLVRFTQRGGKEVEAELSADKKRCTVQSAKWYGRYVDADGVRQESPLCTNKVAAEQMLADLVKRAELGRAGLVDPYEAHRNRPLLDHLGDYEQHLQAKGNSERHIENSISRTGRIIAECVFKRIGDIAAGDVANWLKQCRDGGEFGASTSNGYLTAMKGFCNWLVRDKRVGESPIAHLSRVNAKTDVRRERRCLPGEEFGRLMSSTADNGDLYGMRGVDRVLLYLTAAYTGLRASELASLTTTSFDFASETPTVTVEAGYSKHRRKDVLPLHPDLARRLQEWLADRSQAADDETHVLSINPVSDAKLWPGCWAEKRHAAEILRKDLKAAGVDYRDDQDRVFDFHALRHQFISSLAKAGIHPKTAQELARHSTITLTMDHYTHVGLYDLGAALSSVPALPTGEKSAHLATGTDDSLAPHLQIS